MNPLKTALCAAICFISLATLILLRTVPQSRLWKGYQVLYVTSDTLSEADISAILSQRGCKDFISKSSQTLPVSSALSPLQVQNPDSYLIQRELFFFDKSRNAMVFYIPDSQTGLLSSVIQALQGFGKTTCGTDGSSSFPYLAPILCLIFAAGASYFASKKHFFVPCAFFLTLFAFMRPLYTVSACVSIALAGLFSLQRLYGRKLFLHTAVHAPFIILTLVVPVILLFTSSPVNGLLYALSLAGAISAILLIAMVKDFYYEKRTSFHPVAILRANRIRLVGAKEVTLLSSSALCCILLLVVFLVGGRVAQMGDSSSRPSLPAPVSSHAELPDLQSFYTWAWNTMSFPFRSIYQQNNGKIPQEGETVSVTNYVEQNGKIAEVPQVVMTYDSSFRSRVVDMVKESPYPALEKMLIKQGRGERYGFTKSRGNSTERFAFLMLTLCVTMTLAYTGYFVLVRRVYENHN